MDRFLERHRLSNLSNEEMINLNRYTEGTEFVVKDLLTEKTPTSNGFFSKFYQMFNEEIISFLGRLL